MLIFKTIMVIFLSCIFTLNNITAGIKMKNKKTENANYYLLNALISLCLIILIFILWK